MYKIIGQPINWRYIANNIKYTILLTNFIFMIMHLKNTFHLLMLIGIFISGIIFSMVYYEKKLIIYPIFVHFWFNLFYLLIITSNIK